MIWLLIVLTPALTGNVLGAPKSNSFSYLMFNQRGGKTSVENSMNPYRIHLRMIEERFSKFSLAGFFILKPYIHYYKLTLVGSKLEGDLLPVEFTLSTTVSEYNRKPDVEWKLFKLYCATGKFQTVNKCMDIKPHIGNKSLRIITADFQVRDNNGIAAILTLNISGPRVISQFAIHSFESGLREKEREKGLAAIYERSM